MSRVPGASLRNSELKPGFKNNDKNCDAEFASENEDIIAFPDEVTKLLRGYGSFVATNKRFPGISTKPKFPMTIPFEHELLLVGKAHKI